MGITEKIFTEIIYCSVLDISIISCFYAEAVPVQSTHTE